MSDKKSDMASNSKLTTRAKNEPLDTQMATLNQGLMSLYHASAELQFSKPLASLLKSILRGLKSGTGISKAAIFIKEESSDQLKGACAMGFNEKRVLEMTVPLAPEEEPELLKVNLSPGDGMNIGPAYARLAGFLEKELETKSTALLPLEIRDHLTGFLVYEKTPSLLHQEILVIFSRQAALTIENARLFAKVEEMALRDTLTGLYNRRYFQQILDYELNRAKRYRQPLSLIFIDIDHFKEINDTFGHSMGDQFLKQISQKLFSLFRTTDLVARYAGDEFVAILPATPQDGAMILANRIQDVLSHYQVMARGRTLQVSVSIGVDTYQSTEGVGSVALIDRADKAMYEAKSNGRNCVRSFQEIQKAAV